MEPTLFVVGILVRACSAFLRRYFDERRVLRGRFEGVMLHYANVSDVVLNRKPEGGMVLQQPKVRRQMMVPI